jgi:hypothetical protein
LRAVQHNLLLLDAIFERTLSWSSPNNLLEEAGFEPWLCEVDILAGDNFVAEINDGLEKADLTVLVWSEHSARSEWTKVEWTAALKREVEESRRRLAIVSLSDAELPVTLSTKNFIDSRQDKEKGLRETIVSLIRLREMGGIAEREAPFALLEPEPDDFVGRAEHFELLHQILVEEGGNQYLLWGGPGGGKSILALKFGWRARGDFDAVVFQRCGQRSASEIGSELASRLAGSLNGQGIDVAKLYLKVKWTR